jgi:hypothetical protein
MVGVVLAVGLGVPYQGAPEDHAGNGGSVEGAAVVVVVWEDGLGGQLGGEERCAQGGLARVLAEG